VTFFLLPTVYVVIERALERRRARRGLAEPTLTPVVAGSDA
jgi:hypothetical protein